MALQQITAIALRVLSLWLLVHLILSLPSIVSTLSTFDMYEEQVIPKWMFVGLAAILFLVGILAVYLLFKAASSVLDRSKDSSSVTLSDDSQKLLFQLAGLYFVVNALSILPRTLLSFINAHTFELSHLFMMAGIFLQLVIGLWLVASASFWRELFQKIRGRA